jgi:hypothetical protein
MKVSETTIYETVEATAWVRDTAKRAATEAAEEVIETLDPNAQEVEVAVQVEIAAKEKQESEQ